MGVPCNTSLVVRSMPMWHWMPFPIPDPSRSLPPMMVSMALLGEDFDFAGSWKSLRYEPFVVGLRSIVHPAAEISPLGLAEVSNELLPRSPKAPRLKKFNRD